MSTKWYKISLRPLGPFFFGNERTFGALNADYFASSNYFPQQTTLLGVLRYRFLEMKKWLRHTPGHKPPSPTDQSVLIGNRGFNVQKLATAQTFGVIKQLSPVLLDSKEGFLFPGALNNGYAFSGQKIDEKEKTGSVWMSHNGGRRDYIPAVKNFDYKSPRTAHFIARGAGKILSYEEVFVPFEKVGIRKQRENELNQKAFFKQTMWLFKKREYQFTFYALLEEHEGDALENFIRDNPRVPMGGERTTYQMTMKKESPLLNSFQTYLNETDQDPNQEQVVLLNDSYIKPDLFQHCHFVIAQTQDFRHITSTVHYEGTQKSGGYQLLAKGSVLYPKENSFNRIQEILTKEASAFFQIGYNDFIHLKGGSVLTYSYKLSNNNQYEPNP